MQIVAVAKKGGGTLKQAVKCMVPCMITNSILKEMNWNGQGGKLKFAKSMCHRVLISKLPQCVITISYSLGLIILLLVYVAHTVSLMCATVHRVYRIVVCFIHSFTLLYDPLSIEKFVTKLSTVDLLLLFLLNFIRVSVTVTEQEKIVTKHSTKKYVTKYSTK